MSYLKGVKGLSQNQAIENLRAVISSDYFKDYRFSIHCRITSDMISVNSIGGWRELTNEPFKVGDLADTVVALLDAVESEGTIYDAFVPLSLSEERLQAMKFEERLYDEDLSLPLIFGIKEENHDTGKYSFRVINLGFKESHFESEGLDLKDAKQKLAVWYRELTRNLNKILPHQIEDKGYP